MTMKLSEIKSPAYIFPMSCVGIVVYHMLKRHGIRVLGFCDNNKAGDGRSYDGCPIISPEQAAEDCLSSTFIISSCRHRKDIADQLRSMGISNIVYAEEILTSEKAEEALCDFDDAAAAEIIREFKSPKSVAKIEMPFYLVPKPDLHGNIKEIGEIHIGLYSAGYMSECRRFDRLTQGAECVKCVTIENTALLRGDAAYYIAHILNSGVFVRNVILQICYDKTFFGSIRQLSDQIERLGADVKRYYLSDFKDNGSPKLDYNIEKTTVIMIIEDILYNAFEDRHKCVFLHIPKTSGTALHNYMGSNSMHFSHKHILDYKRNNEVKFNEYFKFALVRNPWERFVSLYFYVTKKCIRQDYSASEISETAIGIMPTFKDAVLALKSKALDVKTQHEWICDEKGNILVDYVGRFENLSESYEYIARKLGVYTGKPIEKINASKHKPYQEYYDEESKEIVGEYFKKDIELFGYKFD